MKSAPGSCALALCALVWPCLAQPADPMQFTFDGEFRSTPGLAFAFSRGVATLNDSGGPVGPGDARFAEWTSLAGAPSLVEVRKTSGPVHILGSGVDHDGVTPLLVVHQFKPARVDVFTVAGEELLAAEASGIGRIRTNLGATGDLMLGEVPQRRFLPATGVVACGLIVVLCDVTELVEGVWTESGVAFVGSQDQGHTWTLLYDDGPVQPGQKRAREWAMTNWWPMTLGPDPLEVWFTSTDYRNNPGSTGGRALMFRATRTAVGDPWVIEPTSRFYEQEGPVGQHFHTAALVPSGDGGLRAIVSIGDGQPYNRIVSLMREDRDYLDTEGWTIDETYHGSMGTPGTQGNQFCGAAPLDGELLIGGDVSNEQIMRLACDADQAHPTTSWVYGLGSANKANDCSSFVIRTPTPNLPGSAYVSWFQIGGRNVAGSKFSRRVLYSPDGLAWMQAINPESTTPPTIALHGPDIYFHRQVTPRGLFRTPKPACLTRRPLDIGPGGMQRLVASPTVVKGKGGTITALQRSPEGLWLDGGVPIDPQPPCLGQVYRIISANTAPTTLIGTIRPTGAATDFGNAVNSDGVITRAWIRNLDPEKTARPRLTLRSSNKTGAKFEDVRASVTDRWLPVTPTYNLPVPPGYRLEYMVYSGNPFPDDEDFYLALDSVSEGQGFSGYPLWPDTTDPAVGTAFLDETAAVTGFACGPAWTVTLAGSLPDDGFDGTVSTPTRWPLAAAWGDEANYAVLIADTLRRRLVIEIYRAGVKAGSIESTEIYWLRGSSVLVSMADAGDGAGLHASMSVGSLPVREATATQGWTTASMAVPPTEIRFGDGSGLSGDGHTVRQSPMLWWGGQVDTDVARPQQERADLLTSLSFLTLPPGRPECAPDLDGDGALTIHDFLEFQNLLIAGDSRADLDRSSGAGVLDAADFVAFWERFRSGCP